MSERKRELYGYYEGRPLWIVHGEPEPLTPDVRTDEKGIRSVACRICGEYLEYDGFWHCCCGIHLSLTYDPMPRIVGTHAPLIFSQVHRSICSLKS